MVLLFVVQRLLSLLLQDVDQKEERHQLVLLLVVVFQLVALHLLLFYQLLVVDLTVLLHLSLLLFYQLLVVDPLVELESSSVAERMVVEVCCFSFC